MTSANNIASTIYKTRSNVTSYFHLRDINDDLLKKNGELELEVIALKQKLRNIGDSIYVDTVAKIKPLSQFNRGQLIVRPYILSSINCNNTSFPLSVGESL